MEYPNVLFIDLNSFPVIKNIANEEELSSLIGGNVQKNIMYTKNTGIITFYFNPDNPIVIKKDKTDSSYKSHHPLWSYITSPFIIAGPPNDKDIQGLSYSEYHTILDEFYLPPLPLDINKGSEVERGYFSRTTYEMNENMDVEGISIEATFWGLKNEKVGKATIEVIDSDWSDSGLWYTAEANSDHMAEALSSVNVFFNEDAYLQCLEGADESELEELVETTYDNERISIAGKRVAVMTSFHLFAHYTNADGVVKDAVIDTTSYLKNKLNVCAVILDLRTFTTHIDNEHKDSLNDNEIRMESKIHFFSTIGFQSAAHTKPFVVSTHFTKLPIDYVEHSLRFNPEDKHGSLAMYVEDLKPKFKRGIMKIQNMEDAFFNFKYAFKTACFHGDLAFIKEMVTYHLNDDFYEIDENDLLKMAAIKDQAHVFEYLFKNYCHEGMDKNTLEFVIQEKAQHCLRFLLEHGVVDANFHKGVRPLQLAIDTGDPSTIEILLKNDAEVVLVDESISFYVYARVIKSNKEVLALLNEYDNFKKNIQVL